MGLIMSRISTTQAPEARGLSSSSGPLSPIQAAAQQPAAPHPAAPPPVAPAAPAAMAAPIPSKGKRKGKAATAPEAETQPPATKKPKPTAEEQAAAKQANDAKEAAANAAYEQAISSLASVVDAAAGDAKVVERAVRSMDKPSRDRLAKALHVKAAQLGDSSLNDKAENTRELPGLITRITNRIVQNGFAWAAVQREIDARADAQSGDGERLDSQRRSQAMVHKHLVEPLRAAPADERLSEEALVAKREAVKAALEPSFKALQDEIAELPVQLAGELRRIELEWAATWEAYTPGNDAKACNGTLTSRECVGEGLERTPFVGGGCSSPISTQSWPVALSLVAGGGSSRQRRRSSR